MTTVEAQNNVETQNRWWDPRNLPLSLKLMLPIVFIVTFGAAVNLHFADSSARETLTDQIGEAFASQAQSLSTQSREFLTASVSSLQTMALAGDIGEQLSQKNSSYVGSTSEILAEINALDEMWVQGQGSEALVRGVTTTDRVINPAGYQMAQFRAAFPEHVEMFITDRYGATLAATGELTDYSQADEAWWQAAWNGGDGAVYISDPEYDESAGLTVLLVAVPIYDPDTQAVIGILRTAIDMERLFALIGRWSFGESGHGMLLDAEGSVIYDVHPEDTALALRQSFVSGEDGYRVAATETGQELLFGYAQLLPTDLAGQEQLSQIDKAIAGLGWGLVVHQETSETLASVRAFDVSTIVASIIIVVITGVVVWLTVRGVVRPIQELDAITGEIAEGKLDVAIPSTRNDEIGSLTRHFGVMLERQQATLTELARRTRAVETTAEVSRSLSTYLDTQALAAAVVDQVQRAFDYYHAHIYLLDDSRRNLVMMAGTGEAGAAMLRNQHQIPVGKGLVGRTAATLTGILVPDVSQEAGWLPNPLLPQTRAEVAVPITIGKELIGVLDVQHNVVNGLQETDLELLGTVAQQVALAFRNAQAYEQARLRAEQATVINQISQKIENSATIEGVLDVAARELRDAFGAQRTIVELAAKSSR
ncbi:MAG: GAF domain-containing protein [Anaerolineales bacterium]|nr:GAF domain-containing protein [Anaerolineales bacterium]MCB8962434.1 GAF domain-containing protein [Ardenticatenales bacterium]